MYKDNFANDGEEVDNERENAESEESDNNDEEIVIQSNEEISEMSFFIRREKKGTQKVLNGNCSKCGRKSFIPVCIKCLK